MKESKGSAAPETVDLVAENAEGNEVVLVILEERDWDDSREQLLGMQQKFLNYLRFAKDGQLADQHPDLASKRLKIRLYCQSEPVGMAKELLHRLGRKALDEDVAFEIRLIG